MISQPQVEFNAKQLRKTFGEHAMERAENLVAADLSASHDAITGAQKHQGVALEVVIATRDFQRLFINGFTWELPELVAVARQVVKNYYEEDLIPNA